MSKDQERKSVATGAINYTGKGDDNINFVGANVDVGGDIIHNIINIVAGNDRNDRTDRRPRQHLRTSRASKSLAAVSEAAKDVAKALSPRRHRAAGVSLATRPLEDAWCREIPDHKVGDFNLLVYAFQVKDQKSKQTYEDNADHGTDVYSKTKGQPIATVGSSSRELGGHERVYLQLKDNPTCILEFKPQRTGWAIANRIEVKDAAVPASRLAAVCTPGATEIHLFYVTSQDTIKDMAWNSVDGWQPGKLFGDKWPRISKWSSLSALRSANCIKLYYQRDDMICELSYGLGDKRWSYKELATANRGSSIASTSYAGASSTRTVYHVYFQRGDALYGCRTDHDGLDDAKPQTPRPFPTQCSAISAVSWFNGTVGASIRIYYVTDQGEVSEWSWDKRYGWKTKKLTGSEESLLGGSQITALQLMDGTQIRVYYVSYDSQSGAITLKQIAFGRSIKRPMVNSLCSGFS